MSHNHFNISYLHGEPCSALQSRVDLEFDPQASDTMKKHLDRFGDQGFLLPNPLYGSWETTLDYRADPDAKRLEDKFRRVVGF
jgi:predicted secreted acid phosphatase